VAAAKKTSPKSDMRGAVEPTVRTFVQWTPALIRAAEMQADAGNLRYAANLCDWLLTNPIVSSTIRTRVEQLLGLDPTFERSGDKRRSSRAVKALEVGEDWWEAYPESELMQLLIWGLLLGVAPARNAPWTKRDDHGGRVIPTFEVWHPQHLRFDNPTRTWRIRVATSGVGGEVEEVLEPGDGEWTLHTPFGKNRPWAWGFWRCLADLVLLAEYGWQDWGKVSERAILLVLTCLDASAAKEISGYTKTARQQLASDIYARGSEAVAALPPGIDLKAVQAAVEAKNIQGALIEAAHKAIAIVIRGGNLSTDVGKSGSKAATESQSEMGDGGNLRFDAQSLTTTIHDQSLVWWAQFNFGDPALAPWPVYPVEEDEDLKAKVETEEKAFETCDNAERLGFEVDRQKFLEEHKITWCKPGARPKDVKPTTAQGTQPDPAAPAGGDDPNADPEADPTDDEDDPAPEPQARAMEARAKPDGQQNGQTYTDRVTKRATRHGSKELAPTIAGMIAAVHGAGSYEEARAAILSKYEKLASPKELATLTEAALTMAQLGGRLSVREDTPELEE
jgi:hypothetical protein